MEKEGSLQIVGKIWKAPLRILSIITLFIGAYTLVQAVLQIVWYIENPVDVSIFVVLLYLLSVPFAFVTVLLFAYGIHQMAKGEFADKKIIIGFALMILASVANLLYIPVHLGTDGTSFYLLWGIVLICYIICFMYYQGMGSKAMTICAGILLVACSALELEEAVRYYISIQIFDFTGYYFCIKILNLLIAIESLLFVFAIHKGILQQKNHSK